MNSLTKRIEIESSEGEARQPQEGALDKYNSLIHILKGHEEFTLDAKGTIISSNLEAVNVTGYEEHEVIGKPISLFYSKEEKEKAISDLDKATRYKQCVFAGVKLKKRDIAFWAKMEIITLFNEQSQVRGYKVTLKDATHRALSKAR